MIRSGSLARCNGTSHYAIAPPLFSGLTTSYGMVATFRIPAAFATFYSVYRERLFGAVNQMPLSMDVSSDLTPRCYVQLGETLDFVAGTEAIPLGEWVRLAIRRDAEISVRLGSGTVSSATVTTEAITADAAIIAARFDGTGGLFSPERYTQIDLFSLDFLAPFTSDDFLALSAVTPLTDFADLPALSGSTRIGYYHCDGPVMVDRVGSRKARWIVVPDWIPAPIHTSSPTKYFIGGRIGAFAVAGKEFQFGLADSPTFEVGPNRWQFTGDTVAEHDGPVMSGRDHFYVAIGAQAEVPDSGSTELWSEVAADGSRIEWKIDQYGVMTYRMLDTVGAEISAVTASDSIYGMRTISGATAEVLTGLSSSPDTETRVTIPTAGGQPFKVGDVLRIGGGVAPWDAGNAVCEALDAETILVRGGTETAPADGGVLYGTGVKAVRARELALVDIHSRDTEPLAWNFGVRRDPDGTIRFYARGDLVGSGNIGSANVGSSTGVTTYLGKRPGASDNANAIDFRGLSILYNPTDATCKTADIDQTVMVNNRFDCLDAPVQTEGWEVAGYDRREAGRRPYELALRDASGALVDAAYEHPSTGQSASRLEIQQDQQIGSIDTVAEETYIPALTIWEPEHLPDGTVNPNAGDAPYYQELTKATRIPLDDRWTTTYVDPTHPSASDDGNNSGTDPEQPLLTLAAGIARGLHPYGRLLVASGDYSAEGSPFTIEKIKGPARIERHGASGYVTLKEFRQNTNEALHLRNFQSTDRWKIGTGGINAGESRGCSIYDCESSYLSGLAIDGGTRGDMELGLTSSINWAKWFTVKRHNFDTNPLIPGAYTIFAENGVHVSITEYTISGVNGDGSHSLRWQFPFRVTMGHKLGVGPEGASGDGFTFRRMVQDLVMTDSVRDHRELKLTDQTGSGENARGNVPRNGLIWSRLFERRLLPWNFVGAVVDQCLTHLRTWHDYEAVAPKNHSDAKAYEIAYGNRHDGDATHASQNWARAQVGPKTGPLRNETVDGGDFGALACPDYLSAVAVAPGVVALKCNGHPHGGIGQLKLGHQYREKGTSTWIKVPALGKVVGTHRVVVGKTYEFQATLNDGAAVGTIQEIIL